MQNFLTTQFLVVVPLFLVIVFQMWNAIEISQVAKAHQVKGITWRTVLSVALLTGASVFIILNLN